MNAALMLAGVLAADFSLFMQGLAATTVPGSVRTPMPLGEYLKTEHRLPRWHRELMQKHNLFTVQRTQNGTARTFNMVFLDFALEVGDTVLLDLSKQSYQTELQQFAAEAKEYAFAPPMSLGDAYVQRGKEILAIQKAVDISITISDTLLTFTLEQFVEGLREHQLVVGPVRNVIVVSHAHWSGQLLLYSDWSARLVSYESVSALAAELALPDEVFQPRPAGNKPLLIFKGCEAGQATPFLRKLHETLNPRTRLYAPKHWIATAAEQGTENRYEFMGQKFFHRSKVSLRRDMIIQKFQGAGLKDVRGNPIPHNRWNTGWPTDPSLYPDGSFLIKVPLKGAKQPAIKWGGVELPEGPLTGDFVNLGCFKIDLNIGLNTALTKEAYERDKIKALKDTLAALPPDVNDPFSKAHPFPWWVRFRFHPADASDAASKKAQSDWIDSLNWTLTFESRGGSNRIVGAGIGYIYELVVPILDPQGRLLVNYYAKDAPANPVREDLRLDDRTYWESVG